MSDGRIKDILKKIVEMEEDASSVRDCKEKTEILKTLQSQKKKVWELAENTDYDFGF